MKVVGRVAQSVEQLTMGWMVQDQILVGTRFSAHPDRPRGVHPASCTMISFPGIQCPGHGNDHWLSSSEKGKVFPLQAQCGPEGG